MPPAFFFKKKCFLFCKLQNEYYICNNKNEQKITKQTEDLTMKIANIYFKSQCFSNDWRLVYPMILTSKSFNRLNKQDRKDLKMLTDHYEKQGFTKVEFQEIKD